EAAAATIEAAAATRSEARGATAEVLACAASIKSARAAAERTAANAAAREIARADAVASARKLTWTVEVAASDLARAAITESTTRSVANALAGTWSVADALTATDAAGTTITEVARTSSAEVAAVDAARAELTALSVQLLPSARLTVRQRVAACGPTEAVGRCQVAIRRASSVRGVGLPRAGGHVPIEIGPVDVRGSVEIVEVVDRDVVAAPTSIPAPATAPKCAHRDAGAERQADSGRVPAPRIGHHGKRIDRRTPDRGGGVLRHVDHLRVGLFDDDDLLAFDGLRLPCLLRVARGRPPGLRRLPHALDGVHYIALLGQKGVAEVGRPLDVIGQQLHDFGQSRHRLDARIPGLLLYGGREGLSLQ